MGCYKLTYEETPTLFLESDGGKNYSADLQVWVNPESDFLEVGEESLTQGRPDENRGKLSPDSFHFQDVNSNWQVAAVTDLILSVEVAGQPGTYTEIRFNLEVGVPKKLRDGSYIGRNHAAGSSADVANLTAIEVSLGFARQYYKPGSTAIVPKIFATAMEAQLQAIIPGARVNSIFSAPVQSYPAVWEKYWWQNLFGN